MAKLIRLDLKSLDLKPTKTRQFYESEARITLGKLNKSDRNFKYFVREIMYKTKDNIDIEALRDIVSDLQKYICKRINQEESSESCLLPIRDKIKKQRKDSSIEIYKLAED